jgi:fibronectin-binding autotransporter adhesin
MDLTTAGAGSTTLGASSHLYLDLFSNAGNNTGIASAADLIRMFGMVSINSAAMLHITDSTGAMTFALNDSWKLAEFTSAGSVAGGFTTAQIAGPALGSGLQWQTSLSGNSLILSVASTVVPEPTRAVLLLVGTLGLALRRRRVQR